MFSSSVDRASFFWFWFGTMLVGLALGSWSWGWVGILALAGVGALWSWREPRLPEAKFWALAAGLALLMGVYVQWRVPQPSATDISRWAPQRQAIIEAEVVTDPKAGASGQANVLVKPVRLIAPVEAQPQGLLYVKFSQDAIKQLYPGVQVRFIGTLSVPRSATNPGQFDFRAYLARQGVFANFRAESLEVLTQPDSWLTNLRRRLVAAHVDALGSPRGELLASLVLGSNAVVLDPEIQEQFVRVGLAHLLAASGAQVALIVTNCLWLFGRFPLWLRAIGSGLILLLYLIIAGASPSILRAGLMGYAALFFLLYKEQNLLNPGGVFRPESLRILAGVAIALLLWNPFWIIDLGFQLSFLATLGLLLSTPPITRWLDRLPPLIASNFAVCIAAYVWTLPLQLSAFGQLSPYALIANFMAVLVIEIMTIVGFISSLLSLISIGLTQILDWPLGFLLDGLILVVRFFANAPGSTLYPGAFSGVQAGLLYVLLLLAHVEPGRRWIGALGAGAVGLILIPALLPGPNVELTVLEGGQGAILRSEGRTFFVGSGQEAWLKSTVVPYLQRRGITSLAGVMSPMAEPFPILPVAQTWTPQTPQTIVRLGNQTFVRVLEPTAWVVQTEQGRVLYFGKRSEAEQERFLQQFQKELAQVDWIWLDHSFLVAPYLALPKLKGIFATPRKFSARSLREIEATKRLKLYWSKETGAITWQGEDRVITVL